MIEAAIQWFYDRMGKVTYSQANRLGPNSYDCSSAVYNALIAAGMLPSTFRIGSTYSMPTDLANNGWFELQPDANGNYATQRGDIFIWSDPSAHTGIFTGSDSIINVAAYCDGVGELPNEDAFRAMNGNPEVHFWRFGGSVPQTQDNNPTDQNVNKGSVIKFTNTYTLDDVQLVNNIWQAKISALCTTGFTWNDNGIPCTALTEVDDQGYATTDQNVSAGSKVVIPGKFTVLEDPGYTNGEWLAQIQSGDQKFWVDLADATEIDTNVDAGTPTPSQKPTEKTNTQTETPSGNTQEPVSDDNSKDEQPTNNDNKNDNTSSQEPETPKEDNTMAFTDADIAKINAATEDAQKVADEVASSDEVQAIVKEIPDKIKLGVYIFGDTLIGLGLIVPQLAIVLNIGTATQIAALSGLLGVAGTFILTMFGIYKSK